MPSILVACSYQVTPLVRSGARNSRPGGRPTNLMNDTSGQVRSGQTTAGPALILPDEQPASSLVRSLHTST
jgi:hypothetical protein